MNIRDLKYLIALGKYQHFGEAAKACFVSQPSLSIQIKKLEELLGAQLIERTNKKVFITPLGHQVIAKAQRIVDEFDSIKELCDDTKDVFSSKIKIGIIPTIAPYLLPVILQGLKEQFPNLKLLPKESQTRVIVEDLLDSSLDCLVLALPVECPQSEQRELFDEPFYLAVPSSAPLAKFDSIQEKELDNREIMLLEDGHCFRDQALEICQKIGATEQMDLRATSLETLKHMVRAEAGITLMPESAIDANESQIQYIPFQDPVPHRTVGMVWRKSSPKAELFESLHEAIKKLLNKSFNQ